MTNPQLIMLVGVPGAGKSTHMKKFIESGYGIVSTDAIIEVEATKMDKTYNDVFKDIIGPATKLMNANAARFKADRVNVVWDQTNLTTKSREGKLLPFIRAGYEITAIAFETPEDELARRRAQRPGKTIPLHVATSMAASYQRPTKAEGFNKIIVVTPEGEFEDV